MLADWNQASSDYTLPDMPCNYSFICDLVHDEQCNTLKINTYSTHFQRKFSFYVQKIKETTRNKSKHTDLMYHSGKVQVQSSKMYDYKMSFLFPLLSVLSPIRARSITFHKITWLSSKEIFREQGQIIQAETNLYLILYIRRLDRKSRNNLKWT